jgi:hypothetical protein
VLPWLLALAVIGVFFVLPLLKFSAPPGIGGFAEAMKSSPERRHCSPARARRNLWRRRKLLLVRLVEGSLTGNQTRQRKWCRAAGAHGSRTVESELSFANFPVKLNEMVQTILGDTALPFSMFFQMWRDCENSQAGRKRDILPLPLWKSGRNTFFALADL